MGLGSNPFRSVAAGTDLGQASASSVFSPVLENVSPVDRADDSGSSCVVDGGVTGPPIVEAEREVDKPTSRFVSVRLAGRGGGEGQFQISASSIASRASSSRCKTDDAQSSVFASIETSMIVCEDIIDSGRLDLSRAGARVFEKLGSAALLADAVVRRGIGTELDGGFKIADSGTLPTSTSGDSKWLSNLTAGA